MSYEYYDIANDAYARSLDRLSGIESFDARAITDPLQAQVKDNTLRNLQEELFESVHTQFWKENILPSLAKGTKLATTG